VATTHRTFFATILRDLTRFNQNSVVPSTAQGIAQPSHRPTQAGPGLQGSWTKPRPKQSPSALSTSAFLPTLAPRDLDSHASHERRGTSTPDNT
jgi:hypothetical protein